jgi:hypothetical protein
LNVRRWLAVSVLLMLVSLAACRSAFVQATITNNSGGDISDVQVDYPTASFGLNNIAGGASYHYRFKIQGSGKPKISFTDAVRKTHQAEGPELHENEEGTLGITIDPGYQVGWQPALHPIR